jgi:hypothetical protein
VEIFFKKLVASIGFILMQVLDVFEGLFRAFAGLEQINAGTGEDFNILSYVLNNESVLTASSVVFIISILCLVIFTIAGIIKAITNNKRTQGKVLGTFAAAILSFFIAQSVVFGGIAISNTILQALNDSIQSSTGATQKMSQNIFDLAVSDDGYRYELGENNKSTGKLYTANDFVLPASSDSVFGTYRRDTLGLFELSPEVTYEKICTEDCVCSGDGTCDGNCEDCESQVAGSNETYKTASGGIADLFKTNLFILFFVPLVLIILIGLSLLKLAQRVFNIVFLYLIMPISISSMPLDDGARFSVWRESMISNSLSVYGTVLTFNLFFLFIPVFSNLKIPNASDFANTIFVVLFILGSAFAMKTAGEVLSSILGVSTPRAGTMKQLAKSITSGAHGVSNAARSTKKALFGGAGSSVSGQSAQGTNSNATGGRKLGGIIGGVGSVAKTGLALALRAGKTAVKALDTGGKVLGGNAYIRAKSGMQRFAKTTVGKVGNLLHGAATKAHGTAIRAGEKIQAGKNTFMEKGGLIGIACTPAKAAANKIKESKSNKKAGD